MRSLKRTRRFAFAIAGAIVLLAALQAYTAKNYLDPDYPYYSGNYAVQTPGPVDALTVVSYNIGFAENIDQAVLELQELRSQKEPDIILLQEMDELGTEQIARQLQLNYVYFPAAVEPTYDKNFGNAILSRWPLVDAQKLILPHKSLSNRMNRVATSATVRIHGVEILVYSIHTESIFTLPRFRKDQYTALLADVDRQAGLVIVGGDFNTFTEAAVAEVEKIYSQAGFVRVSKGSGDAIIKYGAELPSDHIFAKGFIVTESGRMEAATASDHLPIWVTLVQK